MPLMKFHIYENWQTEMITKMLDAAHGAMVRSFNVPIRDRYQIVNVFSADMMIMHDTGLDIPRTERFVLVEVVSRPRTTEEKRAFYANLSEDLHEKCDIALSDVMISFVENTDADWSFGYGRAQFLTKEL
ncbi:tautomerase family protein [Agrobacterium rosae]|uniref:Tautomerase family protein n=1 Tax=Agrobacterium rosae TaxID=1972867 RepID=A0AAW9FIY7_9HYPH|nr:tautomerase family protein [Agrobacterium rosae]MDX8305825.1 tautomerase family protein [Agrobacterium rosae]